jgi:hypothetical protein
MFFSQRCLFAIQTPITLCHTSITVIATFPVSMALFTRVNALTALPTSTWQVAFTRISLTALHGSSSVSEILYWTFNYKIACYKSVKSSRQAVIARQLA